MYAHTAIRQGDVFFIAITELESKLQLRCAKSKLVAVIFNCQGKNQMYGPESFPGYSWLRVSWKEICLNQSIPNQLLSLIQTFEFKLGLHKKNQLRETGHLFIGIFLWRT